MKKLMKKFTDWASKVWEDIKKQPWTYAVCLVAIGAVITVLVLSMIGKIPNHVFWNIFWGVMIFYAGDCYGHWMSSK